AAEAKRVDIQTSLCQFPKLRKKLSASEVQVRGSKLLALLGASSTASGDLSPIAQNHNQTLQQVQHDLVLDHGCLKQISRSWLFPAADALLCQNCRLQSVSKFQHLILKQQKLPEEFSSQSSSLLSNAFHRQKSFCAGYRPQLAAKLLALAGQKV